jgi:exodeoxyribonuclease VII small subunit
MLEIGLATMTPRKKSDGTAQEPPESFEALYRRLEESVARLEGGNLSLEESLSLYEEGMKLAQQCQRMLQEAELRVTRLQEQFSEGTASLREELAEYEPSPVYDEEPVE